MSRAWTAREIVALKEVYGTHTDEELALRFERTALEVAEAAAELALSKNKATFVGTRKMPRWSDADVAIFVQRYPNTSNLEIALELGRSVKSIVSKAHSLRLRKSEQRLEDMGRENVKKRWEI